MVDVSAKPPTARRAVAEAFVALSPETLSLVIDGRAAKGDVLSVAEIAGVMGGQETELGETTTNVVIEAAYFDPASIFRTARRHKLPS